MDQYVVFGNPINHSKSPVIHHLFAEQTKQALVYKACLVEGDFREAAVSFFNKGGKGANVTLPFKEDALAVAERLTDRALAAGAVNTLISKNGILIGDNTDGVGLVLDLERQFGSLQGMRILMLGAGGAARGCVLPLIKAGIKDIHIANRTLSRAEALLSDFKNITPTLTVSSYDNIPAEGYDLVINSTSSGVSGGVPLVPESTFEGVRYAYDMFYKKGKTSFSLFVNKVNPEIKVSDGLGMLVGQAAESFYQWRGKKPDIEPVIKFLQKELSE